MKSTAVFTSTIHPDLIAWVVAYAKERKTTKRMVIEEALSQLQTQVKKERLAESYRRAAQDAETLLLAEMGLGDYLDQLDTLDV